MHHPTPEIEWRTRQNRNENYAGGHFGLVGGKVPARHQKWRTGQDETANWKVIVAVADKRSSRTLGRTNSL